MILFSNWFKISEMIKCIKHRLINIFSFSDTAGRLDYLCVYLGTWGLFLSPLYIPILNHPNIAQFFILIVIILAITSLANSCRRLNDLEKNRLLVFLLFIPIIGIFFALYLLFTPGTKFTKKNE